MISLPCRTLPEIPGQYLVKDESENWFIVETESIEDVREFEPGEYYGPLP